jgi:Predicted permeases
MSVFIAQFAALLGASVLAGIVGSLMGLGGGMIVVPVMTLFMHIDFRVAAGASIIAVIATSSGAAAAYVRDRLANIRVGMFLEIFTVLGAICGALLVGVIRSDALYIVFALVLLYSLVPTALKIAAEFRRASPRRAAAADARPDRLALRLGLEGEYFDPALGRSVSYRLRRVPLGASIMYVAGLASGLLGIGSGAFKVLAMDTVMGMPIKSSTATSNFMIGVTAAASAGIYFARGDIDPLVAAPVALGVLAGSFLGARLLPRMTAVSIRIGFLAVIAIIGIQMFLKGFGLGL